MVPTEMIMDTPPAQDDARAELRIHAGPRRAQQRVRQAQADERQIDDRQKQRYHTKNLLTFCEL